MLAANFRNTQGQVSTLQLHPRMSPKPSPKEVCRHSFCGFFGRGPGGYAAAFLAADLGLQVTLVDLESRLGGVCLLGAAFPRRPSCTWPRASPKPDTWATGASRSPNPASTWLPSGAEGKGYRHTDRRLEATRREAQGGVVRARATFADSQTLKLEAVDGNPLADDQVAFEHCIVATGSSPTRIPAFDLPTHRVMDSTGTWNCPTCPSRCWSSAAATSAWKWAPSTPLWEAGCGSSK